MEFSSLSAVERERLRARGIDPERSYRAWQNAIEQGDIHPKLLRRLRNAKLTPRAMEAASYLAEGLTQRQVAERMNVSYETVRTYARQMRAATGMPNTTSAVHVLFKRGVI